MLGFSWFSPNEKQQLRLKGTFTDAYDRAMKAAAKCSSRRATLYLTCILTQKIGNHAIVRAGLHNLTDRTYWNWSDVRGLTPRDPLLPYLAQAGRSASH